VEATDLARKTAEFAVHDRGKMEDPVGSNAGPAIMPYLLYTGLPAGQPYCASACSLWVHLAAGALDVTPVFKKSGSALGLVRANPSLVIPKEQFDASCVPCIGINVHSDGVHGHAFLIIGFDEATGALTTVDPNSNPSGSREGIGVFVLNIRNIKDPQRVCYLRIA
jgi:hypothetical protein